MRDMQTTLYYYLFESIQVTLTHLNQPPLSSYSNYVDYLFALCVSVRFKNMDNGHLLIRGIKKTDEGMYTCEARVMARGEIDFKMMKVIVNGKRCISVTFCSLLALLFGGIVCSSSGGERLTLTVLEMFCLKL